jgi:hypothetical protein
MCLWACWGTAFAQAPVAMTPAANKIDATSTPYRLIWQNGSGTFVREAFGPQPEMRWNLVFLHADAGPKGYSKHLNWFLARGKTDYALLWCYMNQTGKEFWCWLYQFPSNQLTTVRFTGSYEFVPPDEPVPQVVSEGMSFTVTPRYVGPDFKFLDWTRAVATVKSLELKAVSSPDALTPASPPTVKTLTNLRGLPLHELRVPAANGWRADGWRELHAMVYDAAQDPYYLIVYSNSTTGYAVDLKRAQTYTADFGAKVTFSGDETSFIRPVEPPRDLLETRVKKYEPFEATLVSSIKHENPYTDVTLEADLRGPDGKRTTLPGFWDGNGTWRIRFAPTRVGTWTWRTRSNDSEMHGQEGEIECVAEDASSGGFLVTDTSPAYQHHYLLSDRSRYLPVMIADTIHYNKWENASGSSGTILAAQSTSAESPQFLAFQKHIDDLALSGFNRIWGGYLLDPVDFEKGKQSNGGGKPFLDDNLDHLNPAYFRAMDKRVAYCNAKGIVPDIGIGAFRALTAKYSDIQLRTLWRYLLARYSAYNVVWNIFAPESEPYTLEEDSQIEIYGGMTQLYDPIGHPVTVPVAYMGTMTTEPIKAENSTTADPGKKSKAPPAPLPFVPFANGKWQDVITLTTSNPASVWDAWRYNKPIVIVDTATEGTDANTLRRNIWDVLMRGGLAVAGVKDNIEARVIEARTAANGAKFFNQTRYWRLEPHPELLGGPQEDEAQRRRRRRIESEAAQNGKPTTPLTIPPKADGPIYLLADRAREYVVYFSKGGSALLDLMEATGKIQMRWYNPSTGIFTTAETIMGGEYKTFNAPDGSDWVLHLTRR